MVRSTKSPWIKPEIRRFQTAEEVLAHYCKDLSEADLQTLLRFAEQMQRSSRRGPQIPLSVRSAKR